MDSSGGFTTPPPPPPPPGGDGGGSSLPQRGLGDILSAAFDIYRANAAGLLVIVAVIVVPLSFISALLSGVVFAPDEQTLTNPISGDTYTTTSARSLGVVLLVALVAAAIGVIISAILQAALMRGAAFASIGDPVDMDASYRWGLGRFGSVLLVSILVGITVGIGFLLLVIPGLIFLVMFSVSIPALIVENRRGTDAMSRSWNLVKGHFWHALGVVIVAAIIVAVVSGVLGAIGGDNWFVRWIFSAIAQIITAPFSALVSILLYLDLRARSESLTAQGLRAELASNPT